MRSTYSMSIMNMDLLQNSSNVKEQVYCLYRIVPYISQNMISFNELNSSIGARHTD
jgi:hypothetical protein